MLTTRELNRALLARQLLLEPAAAPPAEVAARVCGLQTQHAPSGYIGMWSRAAAFRRADLTAALERAEVVQGWVMRSTIHMVAAPDYLPFTTAVRAARRAQWLRAEKRAAGLDMPAVAAAVRRYLGDGPLSQPRLVALLAADGFPRVAWAGVQLWVDLLRVPPAGTWDKPRAHLFALAEHVVSSAPVASADDPRPSDPVVDAARELLVTRYLRAFGPASPADVASFTGLSITDVRAVLDRCDLRSFRTEAGGVLVDVPDAPLPGRRHARTRALPGHLGRRAARARPAHPAATRGAAARASSRRPCRVPCRRSSWTARSPAPGPTSVGRSWPCRSTTCPPPRAVPSRRRPSGSRSSTRLPSEARQGRRMFVVEETRARSSASWRSPS